MWTFSHPLIHTEQKKLRACAKPLTKTWERKASFPCAKLMARNSEGSVQTGFQNCNFQFHRLTYPGPSSQREVKWSLQKLGELLKNPMCAKLGCINCLKLNCCSYRLSFTQMQFGKTWTSEAKNIPGLVTRKNLVSYRALVIILSRKCVFCGEILLDVSNTVGVAISLDGLHVALPVSCSCFLNTNFVIIKEVFI